MAVPFFPDLHNGLTELTELRHLSYFLNVTLIEISGIDYVIMEFQLDYWIDKISENEAESV